MQRLADGTVTEVIIATDPNLEGEATATYLSRLLVQPGPAGDAAGLGSARSAATSSTPTRSPSAARSRAAGSSRPSASPAARLARGGSHTPGSYAAGSHTPGSYAPGSMISSELLAVAITAPAASRASAVA